ncbi:hypothetical protein BDD14_1608 [Edaphobacter modestus]|uniref:Uncharacterized protein n=1 Tax=Edaphobacter modestus TaxID=388466 RepID=A0A4Q7YT67_9BACT|nr:hypothetical protein BDD14_1608 [Edaphobacter modestus]
MSNFAFWVHTALELAGNVTFRQFGFTFPTSRLITQVVLATKSIAWRSSVADQKSRASLPISSKTCR